jgi:hypothetical protein
MEVLERRSNALLTGLKTLVDAGISPSSKAFRGFALEAANLGQQLAKLKGGGGDLDLKPVTVKSLIPSTIGDTLPQDVARLLGDYAKKPIELPLHVLARVEGGITNAEEYKNTIGAALLDISTGFRQSDSALAVFGNGFDVASAKADVLRSALQDLISAGVNPLSPAVQELGQQYKAMAALADINSAATGALTSGLTSLGTGLLEGLGQLAAGSLTLEQFGGTMLGLIGKLATQVGEAIVAVGIGLLSLKTAFTNPFAAIAAGAALIVVGAALGSIASGLSSGGSGGSGAAGGSSPTVSNYGQTSNQTTIKVIAEFKLRNQELVALGRSQTFRSRVTD